MWDGGWAGARSLARPQCGHKLLGSVLGSQGGVSGWAKRAARSPECSSPLRQDQTPSGFGIAGANPIVSGRRCTCSGGSLAGRAWRAGRSGRWGWLPAVLPAWGWGGIPSRLGRWEGSSGIWAKTPPQGTQKAEGKVEQSCNCSNRCCGWKSFLTSPDYRWEG